MRLLPCLASALLVLLVPLVSGCGSLGTRRDARVVDARSGDDVSLEHAADALADYDVVFLGELHDNERGHELQLELAELLLARRGLIAISMEMFERDVQPALDAYLAGSIDEAAFLERARPWRSYGEHYRGAIELARREGLAVIAANAPRDLARRAGAEGLASVAGEPHAATRVDAGPGPYRDFFDATMFEVHPPENDDALERMYAAQCLKDDTMAESIARYLESAGPWPPLVVHWNGRFHSDHGLGTVERLRARRPDLAIAVVTMIAAADVRDDVAIEELSAGDFALVVPRPRSDGGR